MVIYRFTKFGHFIPQSHSYIASKINELSIDLLFELLGLPKSVVSDRDPILYILEVTLYSPRINTPI